MEYKEFLNYIKDNLFEMLIANCGSGTEELLKEQESEKMKETGEQPLFDVTLHQIVKNNGIVLDGISIRKKGESISPNIYLNAYFDSYQMGKPISVIMEEIVFRYQKLCEERHIKVGNIAEFEDIKDQIVLRLVHYERNKELLKNCPYQRFLDLAVTFRYLVSKDSLGIASSLISNDEFSCWNITQEELYQIALFNTMREFPWRMDSLAKVITDNLRQQESNCLTEEMLQELEQMEHGVNMYVLTNDQGMNGATCILYDNVIRNFARVQDSNVFLLPSSVHEMMLVPEDQETEPEFLGELVREANQSAVGLIDLLSDNIYYYDREREQIFIYGQNALT